MIYISYDVNKQWLVLIITIFHNKQIVRYFTISVTVLSLLLINIVWFSTFDFFVTGQLARCNNIYHASIDHSQSNLGIIIAEIMH